LRAVRLLQYVLRNIIASLLAGWGVLFALTVLMVRPLVRLAVRFLGPSWTPTLRLALACCALCAVGWLIAHWGRAGVWVFAATIAIRNFGLAPGSDLPWLVQLLFDCFHSARYLGAFFTSLITHVFLFGSLFYGAHLASGRKSARPSLRIQ
jgi:hypothetical protein